MTATPQTAPQSVPSDAETVRARLADILAQVADVDPALVTREQSLVDDLDIDSLSMVELSVLVEDAFAVELEGDDVRGIDTVGSLVDLVLGRLAAA